MRSKHLPAALFMAITAILASCGNTEKILPRKNGTWDLVEVTTERLNASGAVDTLIQESNVAVLTFSDGGLGSIKHLVDNSVNPIVWEAYEGSGGSGEFVELTYMDATGDTLSYLFSVLESKGSSQKWEAVYNNTKTGFGEIVNWHLER